MKSNLTKKKTAPKARKAYSRNDIIKAADEAYSRFELRMLEINKSVENDTSLVSFNSQTAKPGNIYALSDEFASRMPRAVRANSEMMEMANSEITAAGGKDKLALANEERFTAAYYSEPLTQYAVGWTDPEDLESLINHIAPRVPVGRRFEFKSAVNVEAFLSEITDDRAIGAEFKEIEYKGTSVNAKTINRGLRYRLDLDEEGAGILTEELIVSRMLQRLRRNQYRRAISTLLQGTAAAQNTPVTWTYNSGSNSNAQPDEDIRTLIQTVQVQSGVFPNRGLIDLKSWNIRKRTYAQQALGSGAIFGYGRTINDLTEDQSLDAAMISKALYQSAEWVNPTKSYILPQNFLAFYGQDNPTRDDPTNLKHFVTPVADGDFRVYRQPIGPKFVDITVEYYDQTYLTANIGLGQLTVT